MNKIIGIRSNYILRWSHILCGKNIYIAEIHSIVCEFNAIKVNLSFF
jgi:hypothetical protein